MISREMEQKVQYGWITVSDNIVLSEAYVSGFCLIAVSDSNSVANSFPATRVYNCFANVIVLFDRIPVNAHQNKPVRSQLFSTKFGLSILFG